MNKLTIQFKEKYSDYKDFEDKIGALVRDLLDRNNIKYHKIEKRTKEIKTLEEKIHNKQEKYKSLDDITDLVGVRIICYFENEVDIIARAIKKELIVDYKNSEDKRNHNPNSFGYKSLHYVVSLSRKTCELPEYKRFGEYKVEIQIRTILQHAWAEVEHELKYKSKMDISVKVKRKFFRVAAMLEVADKEFLAIKNRIELDKIQNDLDVSEVSLTLISLKMYIESNMLLNEVEGDILKTRKIYEYNFINEDYIQSCYRLLKNSNLNNWGEINDQYKLKADLILRFYKRDINYLPYFHKGFSLFLLSAITAAETGDKEKVKKFFRILPNELIMQDDFLTYEERNEWVEKKANKLLRIYNKVK